MDERQPPSRVRDQPSWLLSRAASRAARLVADRTAELGVTRTTYAVLAALDEFGPAAPDELGHRLGLELADVASLVATLESDGLLRPEGAAGRVAITAAGLRMLERLDEAVALAQDDLLAALPARDRAELARILAALEGA